jgi:hypothetical protein
MAYENRPVQSTTANALPSGTDPLVDNTSLGDVQAIKLLDPTAGSTTPLIGQKAMVGSVPVVVASDQSVIPVSAASLPLPSGAATAANQTAANTSLSSLDTKVGEVQATPTANTLLDRLKALLTGIVLAAGDNLIGRFKLSDGTTVATVRELGTNDALNVSVVDGSGNQVTSFGGSGGTQYAEDTAHVSGDLGTLALVVRKDTAAVTAGTDGDYAALVVGGDGGLWARLSQPLPAGTNAVGKLAANDGVDIGDTTVNNASGASAVNIQDGGNSITIDGTVGVSGVVDVTPVSPAANDYLPVRLTDGSAFYSASSGGSSEVQYTEGDTDSAITGTALLWEDTSDTLRAVSAAKPLPISDAGGSLTVDDGGASLTIDGSVSVSGAVDTELTTADLDTGVGTDTRAVVGLAYGASGGGLLVSTTNPLPVGDNGGSLTVDATSLPLPTGAATETTLAAALTQSDFDTKAGSLTETAPATDTASSGLNGRLQRIAQRLTSLIALLPTALSNGFFQVSVKETITLPASQSGTWTVQPGNTPNTTPWLFSFGRPTTANLTSAVISASSSGDNTLVSGTASQTIRVFKLFLVCNAAVNIIFKDGAGTNLTGTMNMTANGGMTLDFDGEPWFITSSSNGLVLNLSSAQQVSGTIYYIKS